MSVVGYFNEAGHRSDSKVCMYKLAEGMLNGMTSIPYEH
jgi:hypothetical protein